MIPQASSRTPLSRRRALVVAAVIGLVAMLDPVSATDSQLEYPACAVNHQPIYYCCEYGEQKELYTRYNRPTGGDLDSFYQEGWHTKRRVNFPDAFFTPDSPDFHYDKPEEVCRVQRIVQSDGSLRETLQCGSETSIGNDHGGQITTNASLADDSREASVFWTSRTSARNSNTTFPIGATCRSLMLPSGAVDASAKAKCVPGKVAATFRFTTFSEAPLLTVYILYGLLVVFIVLWIPVRGSLSILLRTASSEQSSTNGPVKSGKEGVTRLVDEHNGLVTPMLTRRNSEVELRAAADAIEQTGYADSMVGSLVKWYFFLLTISLMPIVIVVILDSNHHFSPSLFDPTNDVIVVFIVTWVITAVWLTLLVVYYDRMLNFFRVKEPLYRCQYVNMFNPEGSQILLADRSGVSQFIARLENFFFPRLRNGYEQTLKVQTSEDGHRYVEFQHLRYIYDELYGKFLPGGVPFPETYSQILEQSEGLIPHEVSRRLAIVGSNAIEVTMPSTAWSIVQEVFHFFYIYQAMCYYVWFFTGYWKVAVVNTVIIAIVISFNIFSKRRILENVLKMTRVQGGVPVKRDGVWQTIKVSQLVPGDLVRVIQNWELPCDMVIVKGSALCDESALTGESMPVQKFPIPRQSHDLYDPDDASGKKHTLFAGSKTLATGTLRAERNDETLALVTFTGAHTVRGQLIQSILYPSIVRIKYEEHLKACILFLFVYGVIAAYIAMKLLMDNAGLSNTLYAFVYGMFMLSAVLSPLIPVVITVGQVNASRRLQDRGVFCLNPQRVPLSGKVRVFAFDKTGTITKEGLDFRGCLPVEVDPRSRQTAFHHEFNDMLSPDLNLIMKFALATCHAVGYLDEELVGNEVEVRMLEATQWRLVEEHVLDAYSQDKVRTIVESPDGRHSLEILKRHEFDHQRVSMSVVVQDLATQRVFVFCKGSYEKMNEICDEHSLPVDYTNRAERLAREGCYVLGIGFKEITAPEMRSENAYHDRDAVEADLVLLGLIMFQNELKDDSADVIAKLKEGDLRVVMITGDNAMTGCYIARQSGIVRPGARVVLGEILAVNQQGAKALVWKDVDTLEVVPNREVIEMAERAIATHGMDPAAMTPSALLYGDVQGKYDHWELAVTGPAFNYLRKMGDLPKLLFHIRIFSRMTPAEKTDCITEMMAAGAVTGMCGDGGNDCGALRVAHVGVALSDTEASVVAPFTSRHKSIESVLDVCREGRCSLSTSFANLKFLVMYGMIGCGLRFVLYGNAVFMPEYAFMYCDGLILVGLSAVISLAKPLPSLGKERPTASLVGPTTLLSVFGQEIIHIVFLYVCVNSLMTQPWYCPFNPESVDLTKWWLLQDSHLGTVLFLVISMQFIASALAYGFGSRFRRPIYRNYALVVYVALLIGALFYMAVAEPNDFTDRFRIASSTNVIGLPDIPMPLSFRWKLVTLIAANTATVLLYEQLFILGPVKRFLRRRLHRDALQLRL
ncbi:hypothetical protein PINS_up016040 [Pythium insidiosum]|nr:hypothetical protein PINS_up016040 [Pythium insidiosum]